MKLVFSSLLRENSTANVAAVSVGLLEPIVDQSTMNTIGSRSPTGTLALEFSLKSESKTNFNVNDATIKFYRELKLAGNTLPHTVYQKTYKKQNYEFEF